MAIFAEWLGLVGWVSAGYLLYRLLRVALWSRWARHAYPTIERAPAVGEWPARCRGALLGLAIGDAVNLPAESLPRWLARLRYPGGPGMRAGVLRLARRAGDVSDDTQLTICVARSIDPDGTYRHDRFLAELRAWSWFPVAAGRATRTAATALRHGRSAPSRHSAGNGVAVRVVPLAIASIERSDGALARLVEENGRATHAGEAALRAAVCFAIVVRDALRRPAGAFRQPATLAQAIDRAARVSGFEPGLLSPPASDAALLATLRAMGTSGHVAQCIPAALLILLHHRLDFVAAMATVFRAGGDSDSIGALVGAVIGAQTGGGGLPKEWVGTVQHRGYLTWLADRLADARDAPPARGELITVRGNVATRPVDVVVNAWNRNLIPPWLLIPQGVSKAIRRAGGRGAIRAVGRRAPLPLGAATETLAQGMDCGWVVHVAGIDLAWRASETSVRAAVRNALGLARWLGARSVAVPVIGAGSGGLGRALAAALVCEELNRRRGDFDRLELVLPP